MKLTVDYKGKTKDISNIGKFIKIYEGPKKPPQANLSMSFGNKKMQNVKCC